MLNTFYYTHLGFLFIFTQPVKTKSKIMSVVQVVLRQFSNLFKLYHGENKLIFNEMMMRSAKALQEANNNIVCLFLTLLESQTT
jgi:hypothetical protein